MQKKALHDIMRTIAAAGYEAIVCYDWANMGHVSIQLPDEVGEIGSVRFDFQNGWSTMKFEITMNGIKVMSQPPRSGYYDFYMKYTDIEAYKRFKATLTDVLEGKIRIVNKYYGDEYTTAELEEAA